LPFEIKESVGNATPRSYSSTGRTIAWQVEHNGGWLWEVGERRQGLYVAAFGPTDIAHQWRRTLAPGDSFTSVPVGVAISDSALEGAIAQLTKYRRATRRPHHDSDTLPVIYNDYMNTLDGNPTAERLVPLIDAAAAAVGAEYFVIDAAGTTTDPTGGTRSENGFRPRAASLVAGSKRSSTT
jgi:alpha-galactosidase